MKSFHTIGPIGGRRLAGACALIILGLTLQANAQSVNVFTASYGAPGGAPQTTGTFTLNTFTVTGVYTGNSATNETVFVTDGTANGRIFGAQTALAGLTTGVTAQATITDSVFQGTEEFKLPTGILTVATGAVTTMTAPLSELGSTAAFTQGANDSLYASEGSLLFAPVSFTLTPNATGTLSTTSSTTLTDSVSGISVLLFRSATALPYTAGVPVTVSGFEQPFNGLSEIVGAYNIVPAGVPEPSTNALLGLCVAAGLVITARTRRTGRA